MATGNIMVRIGANIKDFEKKMTKVQTKLDKIGEKMTKMGSGMTAGITAPIVALGGTALVSGAQVEASNVQMQNALGLTEKQAEQLTKTSRDIYKRGFGESTQEVDDALFKTKQNIHDLDDSDLNHITTSALTLANTFDADVNEVTRAGQNIIEGFGVEADYAFDLMAKGAQNGLNFSDEMFDNLSEYAPLFADMGFSADEYFNLLVAGAENGVYNLDYVNDAMKEFGIRIQETEGLTADSFAQMSQGTQDMWEQFKNGEVTAEELFRTVTSELSGMEDQVKANEIGVGLFGTKWEDMGAEVVYAMGEADDSMKDVDGTMKEMNDNMENSPLQRWASMWRKLKGSLAPLGDTMLDMAEHIMPALTGGVDLVAGVFERMSPVARIATIAIAGIASAIGPLLVVAGMLMSNFKLLLPTIKAIGGAFTFLGGPIGLAIGAIVALGAGFILAYNKSETFRNFIDGLKEKFTRAWEGAMEFKDKVVQAIEGVKAMFQGEWMEGKSILMKLGLTEDQVLQVELIVLKIQRFFHDMKEKIGDILGEVKGFFMGEFEKVRVWWENDGRLIIDAIGTVFEKVFDKIKQVGRFGLRFVQNLFETFAPIVSGIWNTLRPTMLYLIENVWEKIKLAIGVAMDLIKGIISGVSALIEGDWQKFGQVLKDTAISIRDRIGEYFTNLKDNAIQLFDRLTGGGIQKLTDLKDRGIQKVIEMKDSVMKWFATMRHNVEHRIGLMKLAVTEAFKLLKEGAINRVTEMYNSVTGWFSNLWTSSRQKFNEIRDGISSRITRTKDNVISGVTKLYNRATGIFGDLKEYADDKFDDMVSGAKKLPGRIGSALSNMASYAVNGVKSLGNKMAGSLEGILNDVIGGLNDLLSAIGLGSGDMIPEVDIPRFSTGTGQQRGASSGGYTQRFSTGTENGRIAHDMIGIVNDIGPGNGAGGFRQELIEKSDGTMVMPKGNNIKVPLERGDRIYNGAEVQSMMSAGMIPRFNQGTGVSGLVSGIGNAVKSGFNTVKDVTSNIWDFITKPKKAFQAVIDSVSPSFKGIAGFGGKMAKGAFGFIKDHALDWLTGVFKDNSGGLGTGKKASFMDYRMTTPYSPNSPVPGYPRSFNGGRHYGIDYGTPIGTPVHAPMAGKLTQMWNNGGGKIAKLTSGNLRQFFMHMQSVAPAGNVKAGQFIGRTGNSGQWTTGPHIHWQAQQDTDILNRGTVDPRRVVNGYANGAIVNQSQLAHISEEGPEAVIPLSARRRTRANALYDTVGRTLGRSGEDEAVVKELRRANELNEAIYGAIHETGEKDIVMNHEKVGRLVAKKVKEVNDYEERRSNRFNGRR